VLHSLGIKSGLEVRVRVKIRVKCIKIHSLGYGENYVWVKGLKVRVRFKD
jgi:hypothetical protein